MATLITPSIVTKEALRLLDNELIAKKLVYTDYSNEFIRGVGTSVTIRRPLAFSVRNSMTMSVQDPVEGSVSLTLDKVAGADIRFSDIERTLTIEEYSDRVLKPVMRGIANKIDRDILDNTKYFWSTVGTAGNRVTTWAGFAAAPQRLMEMAVPEGDTHAVMTPNDGYGLAGAFTGTYVQDIARPAIERAKLPSLPGMAAAYMSNNLPVVTAGTRVLADGLTNGASQTSNWADVRTTFKQDLICDDFAASATFKAGDVFTLSGVYAVNPVLSGDGTTTLKPNYSYLQQFVVLEDKQADGAGAVTLSISPPLITSGPYQTCYNSNANTDGLTITFVGAASAIMPVNAAFHRNAIAFVTRPLEMPAGVTDCARETYKGISLRMTPVWDGISSVQNWRFDIIYGTQMIDGRLGTRFFGA